MTVRWRPGCTASPRPRRNRHARNADFGVLGQAANGVHPHFQWVSGVGTRGMEAAPPRPMPNRGHSGTFTLARNYRFEDFEIGVHTRELTKAGIALHAEPKVFDLIVVLVEHCDRVVLRDELLSKVWPGETVCAGAIAQCVCQARRLLGDSAATPRFIRTIQRRGYHFIAPVTMVAEHEETIEHALAV